ncbi:MAG: protein-L-isoaspartate O-methyltransferase family protein [Bosea sp. (in: a-proteobacteria)]
MGGFSDRQARFEDAEAAAAFLLSLRAHGVRHTGLLRAMERVPREAFAPRRCADLARADIVLPLPCGQTMTAPSVVAQMIVALDPKPGERVLEVGTGSAYVSALLAEMGLIVTTIERYRTLALAAHERLHAIGRGGIEIIHGDGLDPPRVAGAIGGFDRILVNGQLAAMPEALAGRLNVGGRLVAAMPMDGLSRMLTLSRGEGGSLAHHLGGALRLPPLAPGISRAM